MEEKLEDVMCGDEYAQAMEAVQELLAVAPKVKTLLSLCGTVKDDEGFEKLFERLKKVQNRVYSVEQSYEHIQQKKEEVENYLNELKRKKDALVFTIINDAENELRGAERNLTLEAQKLEKRYQEALKQAATPVRTQMTNEVVSVIQGLKSEGVEITDAVVASVLNACSYSNWQANQKELKNGYGR